MSLGFFVFAPMKVTAVIVAAGEGLRIGGNLPKPYLPLVGRAMLLRTLDRVFGARNIEKVDGATDIVVIHDGARPFVSPALIERCIESADRNGAVVAGLPARDTIKIVSDDHRVLSTPDRKALWEIQTPQAFRGKLIVEAHQWAVRERFEATDDAMLVERMGKPVWVIDGEKTNLKITMPEDLWLAEAMIREGKIP